MKTLAELFRWWLIFLLIRALVRVVPADRDGDALMAGILAGLRAAHERLSPR